MAARPTVLGRFIEPCDPTGVDSPPGGERDWIHEIKWDGYRAQVHIDGPRVIGEAASTLAVKNAVLDGEVVAIGKGGKPDFQELRRREMTKHLVSGADRANALTNHRSALRRLVGRRSETLGLHRRLQRPGRFACALWSFPAGVNRRCAAQPVGYDDVEYRRQPAGCALARPGPEELMEDLHRESLEEEATHATDEARMVLPGVQAILGFQLIAVFNQRFQDLSEGRQVLHLAAFLSLALAMTLIMAPAAYHRQAERGCVTRRFVDLASLLLTLCLVPLMVGLVIDTYLLVWLIVGTELPSLAVAGGVLLVLVAFWFVMPQLARQARQLDPASPKPGMR